MNDDQNYQDALDYIYSFVDFSQTHQQNLAPENFDLSRMVKIMELMGNPHIKYPIIHVAGTKGKGSVCAICSSVLKECGYKTGLYTSPHLQYFEERIQVSEQTVSRSEFAGLVKRIKPFVTQIPGITTFEITTALAFQYFAEQQVDAAVIEVGLGGRLDATNVCEPQVTVITSLSLDHTGILGNTLAAIAGEKGGIIKPGVPLVTSPQKTEAMQVIERICGERDAPLIITEHDYPYRILSRKIDHQVVEYNSANERPRKLKLSLLGDHQAENGASAFAALHEFDRLVLPISKAGLRKGFRKVFWPGRFEILQKKPLVIVDSAHNPYSAEKLSQTLKDYFPAKRLVLLVGVSADKDLRGIIGPFLGETDHIITAQSTHPRAMPAGDLADIAKEMFKKVNSACSVEAALRMALEYTDRDHVLICYGSVFIAAAFREVWFSKHKHG
ncbi:MAG: bifunctional folylpolyglutamate synthase/dihydrofolate synthase [Anaerolineales bacterium]|nr:bifunctional folylpolyglutamate synthase/dihydrofolate synthase [Anaerolineales bacterium]